MSLNFLSTPGFDCDSKFGELHNKENGTGKRKYKLK